MNKFYKEHKERMKMLSYQETELGRFCVAKIGETFYRAKIITSSGSEVFLIDEGIIKSRNDGSEKIELYPFVQKEQRENSFSFPIPLFSKMILPECSMLCKIHNTKPKNEENRYDDATCQTFERLVKEKKVTILPKGVHEVGTGCIFLGSTLLGTIVFLMKGNFYQGIMAKNLENLEPLI